MRRIVNTVRSARGEQCGRNREQDQADENAEPAVDAWAQKADHEPRDRHAHGARVDRKAHRGRVML